MARAPRAGSNRRPPVGELERYLGPRRWVALQTLLLMRAIGWAAEVAAPGTIQVAYEPPQGFSELRSLLGYGVELFAQNGAGPRGRLANAAVRALRGGDGPLLIAWPDLPSWRPEHAAAALGDLRDGCQLSVGPVFDGGFYLIALARPLSALLGLPARTWRSPDAMSIALAAGHDAGLEGGLLRAERGLHSLEDLRAALADPLLDPELRALLDAGR